MSKTLQLLGLTQLYQIKQTKTKTYFKPNVQSNERESKNGKKLAFLFLTEHSQNTEKSEHFIFVLGHHVSRKDGDPANPGTNQNSTERLRRGVAFLELGDKNGAISTAIPESMIKIPHLPDKNKSPRTSTNTEQLV